MKIPYIIYRAAYTEDSLEAGDAAYTETADEGFCTLQELARTARDHGIVPRRKGDDTSWWESVDPEFDREYLEQGIQKYYTLHVPGLSELRRERFNSVFKKVYQ